MRIQLLASGIILMCLSFILQGLAIGKHVEVRQIATMTEMPKPHEIFTPIGTAYYLSIGSLTVGLTGFLLLICAIRQRTGTAVQE